MTGQIILHSQLMRYVTGMVTRIRSAAPKRLYLKEHREAKGITAEQMAGRLGIERESVYRLEKQALTRLNPQKQLAYAEALGIAPEALWRPPEAISVDEMLDGQSEETKNLVMDVVRRIVAGRR